LSTEIRLLPQTEQPTMKPSPTHPLVIVLAGLGVACWVLGEVFDYTEWKYGKPRRVGLRWNFMGVLAAIPIMIAGIIIALIDHYRR
jgi:hypothetical protein